MKPVPNTGKFDEGITGIFHNRVSRNFDEGAGTIY